MVEARADTEQRTGAARAVQTEREQREAEQKMEHYRSRHLGSKEDGKVRQLRDDIQEFQQDARKAALNGNVFYNLWAQVQMLVGRNPAQVINSQQRSIERSGDRERRRIYQLEKARDQAEDNYLKLQGDEREALEYRTMLNEAIGNLRVELQGLEQQRSERHSGRTPLEDQLSVAEIREKHLQTQRKLRGYEQDLDHLNQVVDNYRTQKAVQQRSLEKVRYEIAQGREDLSELVDRVTAQSVETMDVAPAMIQQVEFAQRAEARAQSYVHSIEGYQSAANRLHHRARNLRRNNREGLTANPEGAGNIEASIEEMKRKQEARNANIDAYQEELRTQPFELLH